MNGCEKLAGKRPQGLQPPDEAQLGTEVVDKGGGGLIDGDVKIFLFLL